MRTTHRLLGAALLLVSASALAGGYDTPILYSARHMGMGGTGIAFVNDPSALFHNPAGLSHTEFISLTGDFSPLMGTVTGSPEQAFGTGLAKMAGVNSESELTFAPFFLLGAGFRVTDWMTLGLAVYPVASSGATHKYKNMGDDVEDKTKLVFIEMTPGASFEIPGANVRIGLGYRMSLVTLERLKKATTAANPALEFDLSGMSFLGFRAGVQWTPMEGLELGLVYRHKTETKVSADSSYVLGFDMGTTDMTFLLPSKLGLGVRTDTGPVGLAVDLEWTFNSQNVDSTITAQPKAQPMAGGIPMATMKLKNEFHWQDSLTARFGVEVSLIDSLRVRGGYIFDGKVANSHYPTAFGTPPSHTHSFTLGSGWVTEKWEANLAYAYRYGSGEVRSGELEDRDPKGCATCGYAGDYAINLHGVYVDFSWYFQ